MYANRQMVQKSSVVAGLVHNACNTTPYYTVNPLLVATVDMSRSEGLDILGSPILRPMHTRQEREGEGSNVTCRTDFYLHQNL